MSYMNSTNQEGHDLSGWGLGECSLEGVDDYVDQNVPMSFCTGTALVSGDMQYEPNNNLSLNNVTGSLHTEQTASGHLFMQSPPVPQDRLDGSNENDNDDCQIIECHSAFGSGSSNEQFNGTRRSFQHFGTSPGIGGDVVEDADVRPASSIYGRALSWKGKKLEASAGQSSGSGSSNFMPDLESGLWQGTRFHHSAANGVPAPTGNSISVNFSEQSLSGFGLSIGGEDSIIPLAISASTNPESYHRNFRLRISASHQQDCMPGIVPSSESVGGSSNILSAHRSLRLARNSLDLGSFGADNENLQGPTTTFVRNSQSRWYRAARSGAGNSNTTISVERSPVQGEELIFRNVSREMSEHPMLIPVTEIGTSSQNSINWTLAAGNAGVSRSVPSSSRSGSSSGVSSRPSSLVTHRNSPQYPRRLSLSEFARRSLISPPTTEQNNSNNPTYCNRSSSEQIHSSGSANRMLQRSHSRSAVLLERQLSRSLGVPYLSRSSAAASEGRSRLVSEIRNVLDLMRRSEGLRVENVMILDQSVFSGMAELHDRHRDMRLDVDNMSYEELLALGEHIGNVSTGLSEETISSHLQQRKYLSLNTKDQVEEEPCCICREEYNDGEDLGILECGHDFHSDCIKQWLTQKNSCPICKTTGLNT